MDGAYAGLLLQGGGVAAVLTRGPDWLKADDGSDLFIDFGQVLSGHIGCLEQQAVH